MAQPVLVRAYNNRRNPLTLPFGDSKHSQTLPPISSYAFADILGKADSPDLQLAIDGIAEICAKNHMSLADEYASHLPPLGEITAATTSAVSPHLLRPGMRTALTSVPEASSGSSEGSRKAKKRSTLFSFRKSPPSNSPPIRRIRIGSMGRTISVRSTSAMAFDTWPGQASSIQSSERSGKISTPASPLPRRQSSEAESSLQRLLANSPKGGQHG